MEPTNYQRHGYGTESRWDRIKRNGSKHYKGGTVEPIDLFRDLQPHESLTALQVKALTDNIKYSYRMLTQGVNPKDCGKIQHYTDMALYVCMIEDYRPVTKPVEIDGNGENITGRE